MSSDCGGLDCLVSPAEGVRVLFVLKNLVGFTSSLPLLAVAVVRFLAGGGL